jgi:type I restriction enzyme S subunit
MRVMQGYKQTDVGLIPEDWDAPELGDILKSMQLGGNYKNSERETRWPLIKMGNLGRGSINLDKVEFVDSAQPPSSRDRLAEDDVLFNTRNTLDLVGKVAIWRNELPEAHFNSNIMRMGFDEAQVSSRRFMNYVLNSSGSLKSLRGIATGTTSVAAIYSRDLVKMKVPLPTKAEQEAIAEALSDADALIESLEHLLTRKRQLKQGVMQELLTGRRRLPGFRAPWDMKRLGDTASLKARIGWQGLTTSEYLESGSNYLVTGTDLRAGRIDWDSCHYVDQSRYVQDKNIQLRERDVLVTKDGTVGKVALVVALPGPATLNSGVFVIRPAGEGFHPEFFYHLLCSSLFANFLSQLSAGSTISHLYQKDFVHFFYQTPPTLEEQSVVAAILTDMDAEIAALGTKLSKARLLKKALMQELLTGRIRLV